MKMVTASPITYHEYIQKNPSYDKYINKKIELHDEMALVVGKDLATGSFAKAFPDVNLTNPTPVDDVNNVEDLLVQKDLSTLDATSSRTKQHCKRNRTNDEIENISDKLGEVAAALTRLSANKLDVGNLYDEIMKINGYDEEFLSSVFDHLVQNEMLAKAFLVKNERLRMIFLENFKKQRH